VKGALVLCLVAVFCAACGAFGIGCSHEPQQAAPQGGTPADSPTSRTDDERPKIVVLGDSLTAGLGLLETQSYPHLLQEKIDRDGFHYEVVNAGVSGDTTAGGLRRLDWALQEDVRVLIVALGGNDGLRGLSVAEMKQNLDYRDRAIEERTSSRRGWKHRPPRRRVCGVVQAGLCELALKYKVLFIPFLLDKVAGQASLNQADGIHPNPQGAAIVADTVWTALKPLLDQISVS
jgi:acyl-CoA thioesterase-1